jgi:peptide/nickel transport system ATP-binding protein
MNTLSETIIEVEDLTVDYLDRKKWINVVNKLSLKIMRGEIFGLAGESGCGKSTTGLALFGYTQPGSYIREGTVTFMGDDLLNMNNSKLRSIRGSKIFLVPQNPSSSLTPSMRIGQQVVETLESHKITNNRQESEDIALELFSQVGLPNPADIYKRYPHQISGGQQQRVVISIALGCKPKLLVMDEPTTALDVTTQARILKLLLKLKFKYGMSFLFITHNLGVLAQICNRVGVMYAGELVEVAPTEELFKNPRHPYTKGLIASVPKLSAPSEGKEILRGLLKRDEIPPGCRFSPRCAYAQSECFHQTQKLKQVKLDHEVACSFWKDF